MPRATDGSRAQNRMVSASTRFSIEELAGVAPLLDLVPAPDVARDRRQVEVKRQQGDRGSELHQRRVGGVEGEVAGAPVVVAGGEVGDLVGGHRLARHTVHREAGEHRQQQARRELGCGASSSPRCRTIRVTAKVSVRIFGSLRISSPDFRTVEPSRVARVQRRPRIHASSLVRPPSSSSVASPSGVTPGLWPRCTTSWLRTCC